MYRAIESFIDGKDGTKYKKGDVYKGAREYSLSSNKNGQGKPVIEKVDEKVEKVTESKKAGKKGK